MRKIITGIIAISTILILLTTSSIPAISASIAKENIETKTITVKLNELVLKMEKDPLVIYYTRDNIITENELNILAERYSGELEELASLTTYNGISSNMGTLDFDPHNGLLYLIATIIAEILAWLERISQNS